MNRFLFFTLIFLLPPFTSCSTNDVVLDATGSLEQVFELEVVDYLVFTDDPDIVVTAVDPEFQQRTVAKAFDITTGKKVREYDLAGQLSTGDLFEFNAITTNSIGTEITVAAKYRFRGRAIDSWDIATGKHLNTFSSPSDDPVSSLVYTSNDSTLIGGGPFGVAVWASDSFFPRLLTNTSGTEVTTLQISSSNTTVYTCPAAVWDLGNETLKENYVDSRSWHGHCSFYPNGDKVLLTFRDVIMQYDVATGRQIGMLDHGIEKASDDDFGTAYHPIDFIKMSLDGSYFVTASDRAFLRVWDSQTGKLLATTGFNGTVTDITFSLDSSMFATVTENGTATVWKLTR